MAYKPIQLVGSPYQNIDEVGLSGAMVAQFQDGYINELKQWNRRAGYSLMFKNYGHGPVHGAYWWERKGWMIYVSGGYVYKQTTFYATPVAIGGVNLNENTRVSFSDDGEYLIMANGGQMVYTNGTAACAYITDADAPTAVSHVAFLNERTVALEVGTNEYHASDVNDSLSWSGVFFTAESSPDALLGMYIADAQIYLFGKTTLETWYDDGTSPYSRRDVIERGCVAPNSVVRANDTWYWLNEERRFVYLNGRTVAAISTPFDKIIYDFAVVSDAIADLCIVGGRYFIVLSFPAEDYTFVYDVALSEWYRWGLWKPDTALLERHIGNYFVYARDWNKHIVCSRESDAVYEQSESYFTDNGSTIRTLMRTAWVDYGTLDVKQSAGLRLKIKCGAEAVGTEPVLMIRWRDNGSDNWKNERVVELGKIGKREFVKEIRRLGQYRSRQYEITLSDPVPLLLVSIEENVVAGNG